jgi:hemoglobin
MPIIGVPLHFCAHKSDGRFHIEISTSFGGGCVIIILKMQPNRTDIATEQDIKTLVDSFYDKVNQDELLSPIFNGVAKVDWQHHLPVMYSFWSSMLLRTATYQGRPWPKHALLPVNATHFARWLSLFKQTVDEHFAGPKADEARNIAASIADTFQNRLELLR